MFMLVVPTRLIPEMVAEFARLGTRRGVIVSAGFKETGESGAALEARLAELAQREEIRFLGPNCMGLINTRCPLNLTAAPFRGGRGGLSLISQSGTYITKTLEYLRARGIALNKAYSVDIGTLVGLPAACGKPLLICSFFGREDHALRTFHEHGIPTFDGPEKAAAAMTFLWRWAQIRQKKRPAAVTAPVPEAVARSVAALGRAVDEFDAKQILAACGIPTVRESRVEKVDEAVAAARRIGFPVAVKGCSAAVLHKTEAHLVHLGLSGDDAVAAAARAVQARMPGIRLLVSEMLDSRREVIAGVSRPAGFPPCVLLGLGGVMAEALEDRVVRLAPLDEEDALEMMDALRGRRVLDAWRGMPAVDRGALAELLVRLGRLADAFPRLQEIDLNPILFVDGRPKVADALFVV
jgi:acetyltransferase